MKRAVVMMGMGMAMGWCACAATHMIEPGDTFDWELNAPTDPDTIEASGGTIINFSGKTAARWVLSGPVNVTVSGDAELSGKITKTADTGQLIFSDSIKVSGVSGSWGFIDADAIAFTSPDSTLTLDGFVGTMDLPEKIGNPIVYAKDVTVSPFGQNVQMGPDFVSPSNVVIRLVNTKVFSAETVMKIPETSCINFQPMSLNAETYAATTLDDGTTYTLTNDVVLSGGIFRTGARTPVTMAGDFTGEGTIDIDFDSNRPRNRIFTGSLEGLSANSTITIAGKSSSQINNNYMTRVSSGFPGTVEIAGSCPTNTISFGVQKLTSWAKLNFGSITSTGKVTANDNTFYGPMLQYNSNQHWHIGRLSGNISVSPSQDPTNCSDLEIDEVADHTEIWIRYGIRLKIGILGSGVKLHYAPNQNANSNLVEVASGGTFQEIEILGSGNVINLKNASVESVTGSGTLRVLDGNVRIGATAPTISVDVQGGNVTFNSGEELESVLAAYPPGIWLDASATETMVGAWNAGWANSDAGKTVLATCPAVTLNGAPSATFTNGFPLIEKWFDKRPEQRLNYGWQDRCVGYTGTLYPLVYPYLVPGGLNGRAYMSFGSYGTVLSETGVYGTGGTSDAEPNYYLEERRRMPLMQDMRAGNSPKGESIPVGTAIMVFGSQSGGGRAVLGGYSQAGSGISNSPNGRVDWLDATYNPSCGLYFARSGSTEDVSAEVSIFASNYSAWLDGVSVNPTSTGFNGGWQVLSFNGNANPFRSLGMSSRYIYAGGQNYAEVIVFTNRLDVVQRRAVENYLAMKWGLPNAVSVKGPVTVAPGLKVQGALLNLSGAGEWVIDMPDARVTEFDGFTGSYSGISTLVATEANRTVTFDGTGFKPTVTTARAEFPSSVTLTVNFGSLKPARGEYDIVHCSESLTGFDTVTVISDHPEIALEVQKIGNRVVLKIKKTGLFMFLN